LTIRHLLQHSSGISRYVFAPEFQKDVKLDPDRTWVPEELLSYVFDKEPLFEAGSDFSYSDTNYIVLGMVIETLTGASLYDYIEAHILKPMDLNRVSPQIDRKITGLATGYSSEQDPFFPGTVVEDGTYRYNLQFEWAGGGFVNNARDLARAGKMIYENALFGKPLMEEYLKGIPAKGSGGAWGLGVHIAKSPIGTSYGHSGFFPGYITNMLYFPEYGFSIAFQVNTSDNKNLSLYRKLHKLIPVIAGYLKE
jgi:D-alanyl-D-alanine carboxypeptidase